MKIILVGYGVSAIGLLGMAVSSQIKAFLIPSLTITAAGVVILLVTSKSSGKSEKSKGKEVPIYKGKEVIGYRIVE